MTSTEEQVLWIPGRVLHACVDPHLGQYVMDTLLRSGLLPAKMPAADSAWHWAAMFLQANGKVRPVMSSVDEDKD